MSRARGASRAGVIRSLHALLSLPSPPTPVVLEAGPLTLSYFGLCIVVGIVVGTWLTGRQLVSRGYDSALAIESLFFVVPLGVLGARLYYVATEYGSQYASNPFPSVLKIWEGGLGVYGAVAGGFVGLLLFCWLRSLDPLTFADAAAPGLVLGQAVGLWGNYFNQELFGRPLDLPWAIYIAPQNRPVQFADATSFHPTFLYEGLWNVVVCLVLLWVARRFPERLAAGDIFMLYVVLYSVGHFLVGTLRVDQSFLVGASLDGNLLVSGALAIGFALLLLLRHSRLASPSQS
jgi:phosphatidylglycerol---prolipoprotein diacylglyceryl transferase